MVRRFNRLLVLLYLLADAGLGMVAFALAYFLRFHGPIAQLIPPVKGIPPFKWYVYMLPFVAVLVPVAFHMQGLYRLRRGRTRLDDFFAVFVGSILAVVLGVFGTLVRRHLLPAGAPERRRRLRGLAGRLGGLPGHQRRCSPICPASWCAKRSSAGGKQGSASSAC